MKYKCAVEYRCGGITPGSSVARSSILLLLNDAQSATPPTCAGPILLIHTSTPEHQSLTCSCLQVGAGGEPRGLIGTMATHIEDEEEINTEAA